MSHYITIIHIDRVRHLKNIEIPLNSDKCTHLILTGRNGSGKTSLLMAIRDNLLTLKGGQLEIVTNDDPRYNPSLDAESFDDCGFSGQLRYSRGGILLDFHLEGELRHIFREGNYITAFYPANRLTKLNMPHGVEDINLQKVYDVNQSPVQDLMKYLVHLKTQQAYARNEGDTVVLE